MTGELDRCELTDSGIPRSGNRVDNRVEDGVTTELSTRPGAFAEYARPEVDVLCRARHRIRGRRAAEGDRPRRGESR